MTPRSPRGRSVRLGAWVCVVVLFGCNDSDPPTTLDPDPDPVCAAGDLLVSSRFSDDVLRYDVATGEFLTVFADGGGMDNPNGIVFDGAGDLLVAQGDAGSVLRFDGTTGEFLSEFVAAGSGGLAGPRGMILGPTGNLIVAGGVSDRVLEFDGDDGSFVRIAAEHPDLDGPVGLALADDVLYVSSGIDGGVFQFDATTGDLVRRIATDVPNTTGLLVDEDGSLIVASAGVMQVRRYDPPTGDLLATVAMGGGLDIPIGLAWAPNGDLIVSSFGTDGVKLYAPSTGAFVRDLVAAGSGGLDGTHFFALVPEGNVLPGGACS